MILFSTILQITDDLTKDAFVQLVMEWNRTSKYQENIVPDVDLRGGYSGKFGNDKLSLEFVDYSEKKILAVRHEKVANDAVVWDTDYVVNFAEKRIAIRLDRTYREDALVMNGEFSTPHFITLLIEGGYLADDGKLPVLRTPIEITDTDVAVLGDALEHSGAYQLPVIYVARSQDGQEGLNTQWLASRLKGAAHVLVEKDKTSCSQCIALAGEKREDFGAVRIYYPAEHMMRKRFLYRSVQGNPKARLEKVIKNVIQYWNSQQLDFLYTWQGVNNALLSECLQNQASKYQEVQTALRDTKEEMDQVYETFDDDLRKMQQKLEELTKANEALTLENSVLRAKLNVTDAMPVVYQGEEEDFYPDEIKEMILDALDETLTNTEQKTRRADVLSDVLANNEYQHLSDQRKQRVKALFKGYKNLSGAMKQELMDLGMTISDDGKHYKLTYKDDPRYMVTIGKTPSDSRAGNNNAALINKIMM